MFAYMKFSDECVTINFIALLLLLYQPALLPAVFCDVVVSQIIFKSFDHLPISFSLYGHTYALLLLSPDPKFFLDPAL